MQASEFDERVMFAAIQMSGVALPKLDDLISTKRFALRPKDLEDIRLLETLRGGEV